MAPLSLPISLLDRANSREGSTEEEALRAVLERAGRAERLGYSRFWVAEHHGVPGIAGSAPAVLMAALAARTGTIRIGSGGIMLPNHRPLVVAEQAATLSALYPGRIDLGLGRSVGFTSAVRRALGADKREAEQFSEHLTELLGYLDGTAAVTARPRDAGRTPLFVLATGSGVDIAAHAGLAVVVGGPALFRRNSAGRSEVLERYRSRFRPSTRFARPYVIAAVNVAVADTEQAAARLLLPEAHALAESRLSGSFPALSAAPVDVAADTPVSGSGRREEMVRTTLAGSIYGTPADVERQIAELVSATGADELMVTGGAFDIAGQQESDRLLAGILGRGWASGASAPPRT